MTKEQLFEKYSIDESHDVWEDSVDNWYSVEVYRAMHEGSLPDVDDVSMIYVLEFLDESIHHFGKKGFGSMYLTSKRMIARHYKHILNELNS
ncbi:MAG: hypothetical protein KAU20_03835 [Nanoarchaeota archaeon]|nr:hypothetical protein [Nanoarchaeota archaeon]